MKISGFTKSFPILSAFLVSTVAFGLFYAYTGMGGHPDFPAGNTTVENYDSIPGKTKGSQDSLYNALILSADKAMMEKNYAKCQSELEKALLIKPGVQTVKDKLSKVKGLQTDKKLQDESVQKAVASGDAYFKAKDYLNAKSAYQQAVSLNPGDAAAKEKLQKALELLRSQKAQNTLFDVAVAGADKLFQAGEYVRAQQEYENASRMLPGDPYPKNRINEIIKIQVDKQVKEEEYAKAIASADKFNVIKNYPSALLGYKKASGIKPDEKYPQDKIKELTDLIAAGKAVDDAYQKAITLADQNFTDIKYADAIKNYNDALTIKPDQTYPKVKIREIEGIMARIQAAQADYDKYVALADSFYVDKKYLKARENYLMATSAKPSESYPKEMISKAEKKLTGQEDAMAREAEEQYVKTIAGADKLLGELSYEPARASYSKASNLKPGEKYPKDKIAEIDLVLASALKDKEEQYKLAIATGDKAYTNKVYETARMEFQKAVAVKPNETYPKTKITELDKLIAAELKQKAFDAKYAITIGHGDSLLMLRMYLPARTEFQNALKMKPTEVYPKSRIAEIDLALADLDKQKALDSQYGASIAAADKLLTEKSYLPARNEYTHAKNLKPLETYPKDKLSEIEKILADLAATKAVEDHYREILAGADKLLAAKNYDEAKTGYQSALGIKPAEQYPKDKMAEIDKALADLAASKTVEENYKAAIAKADQDFTAKNWDPAKTEYASASAIKPSEQYPKSKIAEIEAVLAAAAKDKALGEQYAASIARADQLLADKSFEPALAEYQSAQKLKPAEEYPKGKIGEITTILAGLEKLKTLEAQYNGLVTKADLQLSEKSYVAARTGYLSASALKPQETYPKEKIGAIDKILEDLAAAKALDDKYAGIIANADKLLAAKSYEQSRGAYQEALTVKPAESYPVEKIAGIDKILADLAAAKSLDENYKTAIANGDKFLGEKNYDVARVEYVKATGLKPGEKYPVAKTAEIDGILAGIARQKALDEEYAGMIVKADNLLADKSYAPAKSQYQAALGLKPVEQYPKDKIGEIDKALAGLALLKGLEDRYSVSIANGDKLLLQKSYAPARAEFVNASGIKPQEAYPKDKVAEIDAILAGIAAAKALDDKYAAIIAGADKLLAEKSYDQARAAYLDAGKVKPAESYPVGKVAAIDKILTDIAAAKSLDENYNTAIASGNKFLGEKNYDVARGEYVKATGLKPGEKYPVAKTAEIDVILAGIAKQKALDEEYAGMIVKADKLLADKSYEPSKSQYQAALGLKPAEQYPKEKIGEIDKALAELARLKDIDDRYAATIANGDKLLLQKSYAPARTEFVNASAIKPQESYPKDKITEIDGILAAIAAAKALDDKYAGIIAGADKLLAAKTYDQARTEYVSAGKVKPAESYPGEKVAEIDKILADVAARKLLEENYKAAIARADKQLLAKTYESAKEEYSGASALKPEEAYPKTKIAEIDAILAGIARQKALDEEYAATVAGADKLLADKSYADAKTAYQKAAGLKPAEQYTKTRLAEIDKALADVARLKAIDDQYAAAVEGAGKLFDTKDYEKAKAAYVDAQKIKPGEQLPKDKLAEIGTIQSALLKQKTLDDQYHASIVKADQLLAAKSYDLAKAEYQGAGQLKPEETYPKEKIAAIDDILAELKAKEEAFKASTAKADQLLAEKKYEDARNEYRNAQEIKPLSAYPKEKIAEINKALEDLMGKQKFYENLIITGDNSFKDKDYAKAKDAFQQAAGIFPDQKYPRERITLITNRVDSIYRANKSQYDKAVSDGDRFFNTFEFDKAVDAYNDAANLLPMENYPREMIAKIRRTIAENAIADVLKSTVTIAAGTEKQFPFSSVNIASRKNNFIYIKIKNLSGKPFNVLMRYGKDKQANGGVVMKNLNLEGKVNERLVSVKDQDLWYREDNNWISLYPQGGDVEVSFIQVSRAK